MKAVLTNHLERWHGRGEPHQHDYYRCLGCKSIVTWQAIRKGGCPCLQSRKLAPAVLTRWEKLCLVLLPWWGCVR